LKLIDSSEGGLDSSFLDLDQYMLPQVSMDGSGQFLASDLAKCKVKRVSKERQNTVI
jgi:hypothetical protein